MLPKKLDDTALRNLGMLTLRSRRALLGITQGTHVSLKRGHGIEFSDYRKYEPGDNPRDIDWNLYARSDRMYVKTFNEEQNLAVYLIVDGSRSMRLPRTSEKWDFTASVALGLAYVALSQRDEVSIGVLGAKSLFRVRTLQSFGQMVSLFSTDATSEPDLAADFRAFVSRTRAPGILVFISDFLFPKERLESITTIARSKNLDTTFIQVLSDFDRRPYEYRLGDVIDGETAARASFTGRIPRDEFDRLLAEHNSSVRAMVNSSSIRLVTQTSFEDPVAFIGGNLQEVGLIG